MICPNLIKCEAPLLLDLSPALSGSDPLPSAPLRSQDPSHYQSIKRSQTHGPNVYHRHCHALRWPVWCSKPSPYWLPLLDTYLITHLLAVPLMTFDIMTPAAFSQCFRSIVDLFDDALVSTVTVLGLSQTLGLTVE